MFENLTNKLDTIFQKLRSKGVLTEEHVTESLREVRLALLEADVNFKVVKEFIEKVQTARDWPGCLKEFNPQDNKSLKSFHEELIALLSGSVAPELPLTPDKKSH